MNSLIVELYGHLIGRIEPDKNRLSGFVFTVDSDVFDHYPLSSTVLSIAVPLNLRFTAMQSRRAVNFFNELLPEGQNLRWLLETLPDDQRNTYGLLRRYGKDSAGALMIYEPDDLFDKEKARIEPADAASIERLLLNMPLEPLGNWPNSGRISLGGVQGKVLLAKQGDKWYRALNGYPSSHILKPNLNEYPSMIYDECFCMQLAFNAGLTSFPVWIESFGSMDALVVERFDRDSNLPGERLHMEDFNQALGASGDQKYQEVGGKVSAKRISQALQRFASEDDMRSYAKQLVFATAIGNLDMHAKNTSIFHYPDTRIKLAPVYDQVPLRHQNTDSRMALSIAGEYIHANLSRSHLVSELLSWQTASYSGDKTTSAFIDEELVAIRDALLQTQLHDNAYPRLIEDIHLIIERLLANKPIGRIGS